MSADPHVEYTRLLHERRAAVQRFDRAHVLIGNMRLLIAVSAAALLFLAPVEWLAVPALAFVALAIYHSRLLRERGRARRALAVYERGLARIEDRWIGLGEPGAAFLAADHPYASDLDIFGKGSLFELLSLARTRGGEETLAAWLTAPAPIEEIAGRQGAIEEIRGRVDLREDIAVLGEDVRAGLRPAQLTEWAAAPAVLTSRGVRWLAFALSLASIGAAAWWAWSGSRIPFAAVVAAEALLWWPLRGKIDRVIEAVGGASKDVQLLAELLARLEREEFASPKLRALRAMLDARRRPPSAHIRRLRLLMDLLDSSRNPFMKPFAPVLMWETQIAFAIEAWRAACGPAVGRWLEALGEIEALASLSGYAYENPADPFPEIVEADGPVFDGEDLGHPLIPRDRMVRNTVSLAAGAPLLVVSGSNMSGKSTLLRTIGVNAVLAMAGAPVRAARLRMTAVRTGASIRTVDSLHGGSSRFYSEITRLRLIAGMAREAKGKPTVLFLLDELLHGTNSNDRLAGGEGIVNGLTGLGAIGLVTTHDLALARIGGTIAGARNVHFEDRLENGRMKFDYIMRPGVVTRSNAMELMRSIGLID